LRNCLAGGTYFMSFETMREFTAEKRGCSIAALPLLDTFICGGLAGFFYWTPFYPVDVVKSALMGDSYLAGQRKYSGFMDAASKIYASSGIKGFYRGFIPCLARAFPANGAMLLTVFQLKNMGFPWGKQ
jgi:solute carrier family 25 carnitine/acylcarnitine transporter 20/29